MRVNKRVSQYSLLALIVLFSGVAYAAVAKNRYRSKDAEMKKVEVHNMTNENKKVPETDASTPSSQTSNDQSVEEQTPAQTSENIPPVVAENKNDYMIHKNISTTYFWAGEEAGKDNGDISNLPSAWDEDWVKHFGGIDTPDKRNGFYPASFTPKENPFYFALPYNDFNSKGNQKNDPEALAIWGAGKSGDYSICKNQWIKITKSGKTVYAQWQDVGPFGEDDKAYVFGGATPKSKENSHAGLDVSPAVHDYLGLGDVDKTDWQFVDAKDVPSGPWKNIVTTSQVYWK